MKTQIQIDYTTPIEFGRGWNCCIGVESKVIVFDNGHRWAVCNYCANQYTGPVYSLAIFDMYSFSYSQQYILEMEDDNAKSF
jgi:hypothetical protein